MYYIMSRGQRQGMCKSFQSLMTQLVYDGCWGSKVVGLVKICMSHSSDMCHVSNNSAIHSSDLSAKMIYALMGNSNIKQSITDAWNDACIHQLQSQSQVYFLSTTEPSLQSTKLFPSSGNTHFQGLYFKVVIGHDTSKVSASLLDRYRGVANCCHKIQASNPIFVKQNVFPESVAKGSF